MYLDVRTLAVIMLVGALIAGFGMAGLSRRFSKSINGIRRFSYGIILFIFGWGLSGLEHRIPDFFAFVFAPILLLYGDVIIYQAIRRFQEDRYDSRAGYSVVAFAGALLILFTFVYPSALWRVLTGMIASAILLGYCGLALVWKRPMPLAASAKITAGGFFWFSAVTFMGAILIIFSRISIESFYKNSYENGIMIGGFIVGMLVVVFGFVMMIHDKNHIHLEKMATHDELTGVYNRRTIMEFLKVASANSRRNVTPLSVLMIDLDDFKQVNDKHGHMEGDIVLAVVSKTLASVMRDNDSLGRYGGEEFLAVLPNTELAGARVLAERVRAAVQGKVFMLAGQPLSLTASVGVAFVPVAENGGDSLLQRADLALMGAKSRGRDLVVIAE